MIAKKVYTESSSYFGGKNPLDDTSSTIIEFKKNLKNFFIITNLIIIHLN